MQIFSVKFHAVKGAARGWRSFKHDWFNNIFAYPFHVLTVVNASMLVTTIVY